MDGWDIALLAIAGFVATTALARLMLDRRRQLVDELLQQAEQQKKQSPEKPAK